MIQQSSYNYKQHIIIPLQINELHNTWQLDMFSYLIIINVTRISMFRNYSFNFRRNVAKRGRNMERRRERNIAEPKFELKSFRPSSCVFYGRGRI